MICPLAGTHKVLKTFASGLLLLAIAGCGPGWDLENIVAAAEEIEQTGAFNPDLAAAAPVADSSSSAINIAPGNDYTTRVRALSADDSVGSWSAAIPLTPPLNSSFVKGMQADASVVDSLQVDWPAMEDAVAWEIIIERGSDKKRVVHRTVDTADLCDADGICSIKAKFNSQERISESAPVAVASPAYGPAPLYVSFDIEDFVKSDIRSADWMLSGSTTDFPERTSWTGSFDKPGTYEFVLLTIDKLGQEELSTVSITVTEGAATQTETVAEAEAEAEAEAGIETGTIAETETGSDEDLVSVPEAPVESDTSAPELVVLPPEVIEAPDSTQEPSPVVSEVTDTKDTAETIPDVEIVDSTPVIKEPEESAPAETTDVAEAPIAGEAPDVAESSDTTESTDVTESAEVPATEESVQTAETDTGAGEESTTPDNSVQTGPVISNVSVSQINEQLATITWDMDRVATGVIEYGTDEQLGQWSNEETSFNWASHRQTLSGLKPGTTYYFRVHSKDETGNASASETTAFSTLGGEPIAVVEQTGPAISNITVTHISDRDATIVWELDRFATGVIEYGVDEQFGQWTTKEESFSWSSHRQTLGGLQPETTYYYRVHADDETGESSFSETQTFTTYEADLTLAAAKTEVSDSNDNSAYKNNLPYGGLFYGNPTGGVHTANSRIAVNNSRRFRAERSGQVESVRYHNRFLLQSDIDSRCKSYGRSATGARAKWCACKDAGLDPISCSYTLGSSYQVGNGGLITIEVRPDDGNGLPSSTILAKSSPYVPGNLKLNGYPVVKFTSPAQLTAGNVYHLVYSNSKPPIKCALSNVALSKAGSCDRDRGAIGLNGVFYPHSSTTTGRLGPWYGTKSAGNLYQSSAGGSWKLYGQNLSWYELGYTDGVNVGDSYHSLNVTKGTMKRDIQSSIRARQRFTVLDASRRVDGVWLNFGHTNTANGSSLSVALKDKTGNILANGKISASAECRQKAKGVTWDRHCRDWGYATFDKTTELLEGSEYSVEFSAASGAGFSMSTIEPLSRSHPFDDRNDWVKSRGEISTNGGKSWGQWDARMPDERDMSVLFTIEGMPRQMP